MTAKKAADELPALVVTAGGERFAVPVAQIASLTVASPFGTEFSVSLAKVLGLGTEGPGDAETHVLTTRAGRTFRLEGVGDLVKLPLSSIRRLPPVLLDEEKSRFAAALLDGAPPLLLLDLDRLKGI